MPPAAAYSAERGGPRLNRAPPHEVVAWAPGTMKARHVGSAARAPAARGDGRRNGAFDGVVWPRSRRPRPGRRAVASSPGAEDHAPSRHVEPSPSQHARALRSEYPLRPLEPSLMPRVRASISSLSSIAPLRPRTRPGSSSRRTAVHHLLQSSAACRPPGGRRARPPEPSASRRFASSRGAMLR